MDTDIWIAYLTMIVLQIIAQWRLSMMYFNSCPSQNQRALKQIPQIFINWHIWSANT